MTEFFRFFVPSTNAWNRFHERIFVFISDFFLFQRFPIAFCSVGWRDGTPEPTVQRTADPTFPCVARTQMAAAVAGGSRIILPVTGRQRCPENQPRPTGLLHCASPDCRSAAIRHKTVKTKNFKVQNANRLRTQQLRHSIEDSHSSPVDK